jgi:hypothetical protein
VGNSQTLAGLNQLFCHRDLSDTPLCDLLEELPSFDPIDDTDHSEDEIEDVVVAVAGQAPKVGQGS